MKSNLSFFHLFFEVWIHPRKVIQTILESQPGFFVWPMVISYSILNAVDPFSLHYFSYFAGIFIWSLLGFLGFIFYSWIIFRIGKRFGGIGSYIDLKPACAWSYPPLFVGLFFSFSKEMPELIRVFHRESNLRSFLATPIDDWYHPLRAISFLLTVWAAVLNILTVSQVHKFSVWKSFFVSAICWMPGWVLLIMVFIYFYFLIRPFPLYH